MDLLLSCSPAQVVGEHQQHIAKEYPAGPSRSQRPQNPAEASLLTRSIPQAAHSHVQPAAGLLQSCLFRHNPCQPQQHLLPATTPRPLVSSQAT